MCACNATFHSALEVCLNWGVFIGSAAEMQDSAAAYAARGKRACLCWSEGSHRCLCWRSWLFLIGLFIRYYRCKKLEALTISYSSTSSIIH